jgi:PAS domain S-box-containing protein
MDKVESYLTFLDAMDEGFCIIEMIFDDNLKPLDYKFLQVNSAFETHTGLTDVIGKKIKDLVPGHDEHWFVTYGKVALTGQPLRFTNYAEKLHRHYNVFAYPFGNPENRLVAVLFKDITKEKLAQEELVEAEARFRTTLDNMIEGCAIFDFSWDYKYVNESFAKYVHSEPRKILGRKIWDVTPGVEKSSFYAKYKLCMEERSVQQIEDKFVFPDGSEGWFEAIAQPVPEGIFVLAIKITERKIAENQLRKALAEKDVALKEKDVLLRELYHRTKNNMQVISSLLNMKGEKTTNELYRNDFFEMKSRIHAMSLVHDMLYQTKSLSSLNLGEYVKNLVNLLVVGHSDKSKEIKVSVEFSDCDATIDIAISCGIIITELVINVFKYAFPENRTGNLNIKLSNHIDGLIKMTISDDGVGMQASEIYNEDKLGTQLVKGLVEDQLNGEILISTSSKGTCWTITFPN